MNDALAWYSWTTLGVRPVGSFAEVITEPRPLSLATTRRLCWASTETAEGYHPGGEQATEADRVAGSGVPVDRERVVATQRDREPACGHCRDPGRGAAVRGVREGNDREGPDHAQRRGIDDRYGVAVGVGD